MTNTNLHLAGIERVREREKEEKRGEIVHLKTAMSNAMEDYIAF